MESTVTWTVVGAGPAGIACIGQLLDAGINPKQIAWVDPCFTVGDFGTLWKHVSSNTPVESFTKVLNDFKSFQYNSDDNKYFIDRMKPEMRCPLMVAAQPLNDITQLLRQQVLSYTDLVIRISPTKSNWRLTLASGAKIHSEKIILAIGAEARTLNFPSLQTITLATAANPNLLSKALTDQDVVAVFGAYQSSRTVEENLANTHVKTIYHFYRSQREFDTHVGSLDLDERVVPVQISNANFLKFIPRCNKAIYAVGFQRRHISIDNMPEDYGYNYETGEIAPGIFGLGIAFPEVIPYSHGRLQYKVTAARPFVKHLKKVFSVWVASDGLVCST